MREPIIKQVGLIALRTLSGKFLAPDPIFILVGYVDKYGLTDLESESVKDSVGFFVAKINKVKGELKNETII
jgi:hypothetical protein